MSTTAIINAKIFDGEKLSETKTIVIENGMISDKTTGDVVIDGSSCTLLPGLIDSHVHVDVVEHLQAAAKSGVTTMFEMANHSPEVIDSLRSCEGLTNILSCYYPATAEQKMNFSKEAIVKDCEDAERYVKEIVALGADYIKIIMEDPSPEHCAFSPEVIGAIVDAAHRYGKLTVAHVVSLGTYKTAVETGVDILTHMPFAAVLPQPLVDAMAEKKIIDIPTMGMMEGIVSKVKKMNPAAPIDFHNVTLSVEKLHKAGITILAGTDANDQCLAPYQWPHGESLHRELELLVGAGLKPIEALKSATSLPTKIFGLKDRGIIEAGRRADLLLVEGDPTVDIKAIKAVKAVWINGIKIHIE